MPNSFQPDMLISDVIMADLNGIDAAIRIRALLPKIKILLFSGQAATADLLEKARAEGYEFDILAKPVHPAGSAGQAARIIPTRQRVLDLGADRSQFIRK